MCFGCAEKIGTLAKQFGKWHGISSLINLGTLVTAVGHGYWLAGGLACCGAKPKALHGCGSTLVTNSFIVALLPLEP